MSARSLRRGLYAWMNMYIFFADDSTQSSDREGMGQLVSFGGVLIKFEKIKLVNEKIEGVISKYRIPKGVEIKWSPPSGHWLHENLKEERTALYGEIVACVREEDAKAIVVVWDTGRTTLKGQDAFQRCVDYAFERVTTYLAKCDSYCIIVADRPGGGSRGDEEFLNNFIDRVQSGTEYVPPDRVILNVLTTPSHHVRQLQVADVILGAATGVVAGRYRYSRPVFNEIKKILIDNYYGFIGGTGLKLFPKELVNLYYWILNEEAYVRVSRAGGPGLPHPSFPYYKNEYKQ